MEFLIIMIIGFAIKKAIEASKKTPPSSNQRKAVEEQRRRMEEYESNKPQEQPWTVTPTSPPASRPQRRQPPQPPKRPPARPAELPPQPMAQAEPVRPPQAPPPAPTASWQTPTAQAAPQAAPLATMAAQRQSLPKRPQPIRSEQSEQGKIYQGRAGVKTAAKMPGNIDLRFDRQSIVQGLVMAEVLGKPKSKKAN